MATRITEDAMSSNIARHTAQRTEDSWLVSWLPGRPLTRNQAVTAMTIAEVVRTHTDDLADNQHPLWLHIDGWAAELGITGPHAVAEASLSPEDHATRAEEIRDDARTVAAAGLQQHGPAVVDMFRECAATAGADGECQSSFLMCAEEAEKLLRERSADDDQADPRGGAS